MSNFEFYEEEDEALVPCNAPTSEPSFRPGRMGLGCSVDSIRKKEKEAREKQKLTEKLTGKKKRLDDEVAEITNTGTANQVDQDHETDKSLQITKRAVSSTAIEQLLSAPRQLSKSQKKRMRLKRDQ